MSYLDGINLLKTLSSDEDREEFLGALGLSADHELSDVLNMMGEDFIFKNLLRYAQGFGNMMNEIYAFMNGHNLSVNGTLQISDQTILNISPPSSDWLADDLGTDISKRDPRAHSLSSAVLALGDRINTEQLVFTGKSALASRFSQSENKIEALIEKNSIGSSRNSFCLEADLNLIRAASQTIEDSIQQLMRLAAPANLVSAFSDLQERSAHVISCMDVATKLQTNMPSNSITTLSEEIQIVASQASSICDRIVSVKRAVKSFQTFMQSEAWRQRWRVFEIWTLVRVLSVIEKCGGELQFRKIDGVWWLRYGKDGQPCCTAAFNSSKQLNVYFQLFVDGPNRANMPDIAIECEDASMLAIIEPKHGKSSQYSNLSYMMEILERYCKAFTPKFAVINNYFQVKGYSNEEFKIDDSRGFIISDMSPHSKVNRLFEIEFQKTLLANDYFLF